MPDTAPTSDYWDPADCEGSVHCPARCPRFVDARGDAWPVRPYEPSDREALGAMYDDLDPDQRAQGVPPLDDRRRADWLDTLLDEGWNVVAGGDGRVVGHALYTPTDAAVPELAVFVHQDYQDRGIGTELCRHVVAAAAAADREGLVLDVEPWNRRAARVYEAVGFRRVEGEPLVGSHSVRMRHPLTWTDAFDAQQPPALRE